MCMRFLLNCIKLRSLWFVQCTPRRPFWVWHWCPLFVRCQKCFFLNTDAFLVHLIFSSAALAIVIFLYISCLEYSSKVCYIPTLWRYFKGFRHCFSSPRRFFFEFQTSLRVMTSPFRFITSCGPHAYDCRTSVRFGGTWCCLYSSGSADQVPDAKFEKALKFELPTAKLILKK